MQSVKGMMPDPDKFNQLPSMEEVRQEILQYPAIQEFLEEHEAIIDQKMLSYSFSKLHEYMREHQRLEAGKEGTKPGFYPELFINNQTFIDVRYLPTQRHLKERSERNRQARIHNQTMSAEVRHAEIRDFDLDTSSRQQLLSAVMTFIEEYQRQGGFTKGLYISGPFGVGKTFLMGAMVNDLSRMDHQLTIGMVHIPTFANDLKETFQNNTTQQVINQIKEMDLLVLDDIGAESMTPWLRDDVLSVILEHRMKENLATFFTSNFSMRDLQSHLAQTRDSVSEVKAARIMERVRYLAKEFHLLGENRRH